MSTPFHALSTLVARLRGHLDWYSDFNSLARHTKTINDAVANLSVGSAPGQFAPYDTRFYIVESGFSSNAYTAATSPVATGLALPTGWSALFVFANANTGAATMNIGSTDGAVTIKKYSSGSKADLGSGDIVVGLPTRMTFDGTHWVMQLIPAPVSLAGYATESYVNSAIDAIDNMKFTVHTAGGTHNFNAGSLYAWVEVIGAGGGGGKPGSGGVVGIPGGGGGYCAKLINLSGISSATITVGTGGAGGTSTSGGNGGSSSYADGTSTLTANGGNGGNGNSTSGAEGAAAGGTASGGTINYQGTAGSHKHTRYCTAGAPYMSSAVGGGTGVLVPGGGGGTDYTPNNGHAGANGVVRIKEWF